MKKLMLVVMTAVIGLVAGACSGTVEANNVEVGTCTNLSAEEDLVGEIPEVDCDEPHTEEVFALFDVSGDEFPGQATIADDAFEGCTGSRFEGYVGAAYESSEVYVTFLAPNQDTWDKADDRTVICLARESDGSSRTSSVKGLGG